jgi:hypothetical protein
MAMTRLDLERGWLEPFGRDWLAEWRFRPSLRRMIEDDHLKVDEFGEDHEVVIRASSPGWIPTATWTSAWSTATW